MFNEKTKRGLYLLTSTSVITLGLVAAPVTVNFDLDKPILTVAQTEADGGEGGGEGGEGGEGANSGHGNAGEVGDDGAEAGEAGEAGETGDDESESS